MSSHPLLSIAIPAYGRPGELEHALRIFIRQIAGKYEDDIEIVISDDCTPDDGLAFLKNYSDEYSFIKYRRYPDNIGLEKNLIACTETCAGEYLWIFGDDDYIEENDGLDQVMRLLKDGEYEFIVLNRTRRSSDLRKIISENWMRIDPWKNYSYAGLREFCLVYGFISVIGFISVNIFRRRPFADIDASKYYGTMYPQLGSMVEAFHDNKTLLVGRPLVCHRTQTAEEKRAALGNKSSESGFMADSRRRNAIYFSHPYINMLAMLVEKGALRREDIVVIPENTVIDGLLIDFLIQTLELNYELKIDCDIAVWSRSKQFVDGLPLDAKRRKKANSIFSKAERMLKYNKESASESQIRDRAPLSISVISPSYNQGEFLRYCLTSVSSQTYKPIEHLVYDPGSTDDSREIAANFPHVTLIAESDTGQSDALNKGFTRARGDIIAWVNSDDCYVDDKVFERVVERFGRADSPDIVYGRGVYIDEAGNKLRDVYINKDPSSLNWRLQQEDGILQPALFMKKSVIERVGPLRNDLHYCMDYEYWIRCIKSSIKFAYLDENLALARYHSSNKTYGMRGNSYLEVCDMLKEQFGYVNHVWLRRYAEFLTEGHDGVLSHSGNAGIKDKNKLEAIYQDLLLAYNGVHDTYRMLIEKASTRGPGDTLREIKKLNIEPPVPCKVIPIDQVTESGHVAYTVGPRRWAFKNEWKADQISRAHDFLREQIANRKSDTCIIVGNGPSLNKTDLSLLKDQDVIVSNNVFLSSELLKYATYYTVVNYLVAEQSSQHINRLRGINKILPFWMAYCLNPDENTYFVDAVGRAEFSKDMFKNMSWRHTVTFFNLHLAYGLGYKKVILIGFDHNYKQPKNVIEQDVIQSYDEDDNHFHPGYFRGKKWQAADVDMMEEMYRLAKAAFEEDGRVIINSTEGGKLELFERMPLHEALGLEHHRITAPGCSLELYSNELLVGPYARNAHARCDETNVVAKLFSAAMSGATMIDVGAHHGTALAPFLDMGWRVHAFEPDGNNRAKLLDRLSRHCNADQVTVDNRCVSNKSQRDVTFYRSDVSTGISGLSAFHDSHIEAGCVDTTTLTEYFSDKEIPIIDFLKIDTEGHDLFVLQGYPWGRSRPAIIECEFEDAKTVPLGYTYHDLAHYLKEHGYVVYVSEWHPVIRYGIRHDWYGLKRYPCELTTPEAWGNLIGFSERPDETVLKDVFLSCIAAEKPKLVNIAPDMPKDPVTVAGTNANRASVRSHRHRPTRSAFANMRHKVRLAYMNLASAVRAKSPMLFRVCQAAAWSARGAYRNPVMSLSLTGVMAALAILPLHHQLWLYRYYFWVAAAVLVFSALVIAGVYVIRYALRRILESIPAELAAHTSMMKRDFSKKIGVVEEKFKTLSKDVKKCDMKSHEFSEIINNLTENHRGDLLSLDEKMSGALHEMCAEIISKFQGEIEDVVSRQSTMILEHEADIQQFVNILRTQLEEMRRKISPITLQVDQNTTFQRFNRVLTSEHINTLHSGWVGRLEVNATKGSLAYMAHRIRITEQNSVGRLATQIEDAVLRTLVSSAVKGNTLEILEIGTLFGIGLAMLYEHNHARYENIHVTAIDPLEGYYGALVPDIVLKVPVTKTTFWMNMMRFGIPREDITLIDAMSTTDEAMLAAGKRKYNVLIIDGDHSYAGVKADFENYIGMMRDGGFIIFDDYNSSDWPDVKRYVDDEVMNRKDMIFIGAEWRTAIFKVVNESQVG